MRVLVVQRGMYHEVLWERSNLTKSKYRWTQGAWAVVADKLVKQGVFIAISAGNTGELGSWYASSGSTGIDVLSVASVDNEQTYAIGAEARSGAEKKAIVSS